MKKTILITGGCGFIGSHFVDLILNLGVYNLVNIDKLTYAANLEYAKDNLEKGYKFIKGDISDFEFLLDIAKTYHPNYIVNFAAETHVDNSLINSDEFIKSNITGTYNLLKTVLYLNEVASSDHNSDFEFLKFLQVSTDEVYGEILGKDSFTEISKIQPNNPYSASKASADLLCLSYHHTFKLPINISRSSNNYGIRQHREKLIPKSIIYALQNQDIPIYGDGLQIRDWLHVEDNCSALFQILLFGESGEVYNVGSNQEMTNIDLVNAIINHVPYSKSRVVFVNDRLGHDRRYAINNTKLTRHLKWSSKFNLQDSIKDVISYYERLIIKP